jgi:SAM-dependent methyltransferase
MAKRPKQNDDGGQLNLFSSNQNRYDSNHTDPIRQNGGEALARIPPEHGGGNGSQRNLQEMLLEAEEKTASEMHDLTMKFQQQGLTAQQANDRAWEMVREEYILLPPKRASSPQPEQLPDFPRRWRWRRLAQGKVPRQSRRDKTGSQTSGRKPTGHQEEKSALVRYVGWGGLPQIFSPATDWQAESRELSKLISKEEFRLARASTLNAHYTSGEIIQGMYAALERLGFKEGRILEPACGIGHFVGFMPEAIQSQSVITGIELDPVTAQIAKALYPDADIRNESFEKANVADEFYDVAISNIPFGDYKPFDPKFNKQGFLIHDYFFARGLEKVRPGGLVMFITSRGTMDKMDNTLRKYVAERANLIGAIRLPNTAFKRNANTEVTTDIIILKKLRPRETTKGVKWEKVIPYTSTNGEVIPINEYFVKNQHMMLGEMQLKGRMYSQQPANARQ